jgi:hypothetical protein
VGSWSSPERSRLPLARRRPSLAKKESSGVHLLGTIILALGILWILFDFVTIAAGEVVLYLGWLAGCIASFGLYCGPFTFDWTGLLKTFVLPIATVAVGLVLRRVR